MTPPEPTADQCSSNERIIIDRAECMALWYPQMGGYVGKALAVREGGCFTVWVWHDGEFPFHCGENPTKLHHCSAEQFVKFGRLLETL